MIRLPRSFIPPGWRALGKGDPWVLAGIVAAIAGAGWLLSPAGAVAKLRDARDELAPEKPANATGRALGYRRVPRGSGGDPYPLSVDPLDTLGRGARVRSTTQPRLVHGPLPGYLRAPRMNLLPLRAGDLRNLAAMPPVLPPAPTGNPSLSASEVLAAQLGKAGKHA